MIAPRIKLRGSLREADALIGFAKSQLEILHRDMKFQDLKQLKRKVNLLGGAVVDLSSCFDLNDITIYVPEAAVEVEEEKVQIAQAEILGVASGTHAGVPDITLDSGSWNLHETGIIYIDTESAGCWDCNLCAAQDGGEDNNCGGIALCHSDDGKGKWLMQDAYCLAKLDEEWTACNCTCFSGDTSPGWEQVGGANPGDPAEHPPSLNPCELNSYECDICCGEAFPMPCISCVYTGYRYYEWDPE